MSARRIWLGFSAAFMAVGLVYVAVFVVPPLIISRDELESGLTLLDEGIAESMA